MFSKAKTAFDCTMLLGALSFAAVGWWQLMDDVSETIREYIAEDEV